MNTIDEIAPNGIYNENSGTSEPRIINNFNDRTNSLKIILEIIAVLAGVYQNLFFYDTPKELSEFGKTRPPQSWCYVNKE